MKFIWLTPRYGGPLMLVNFSLVWMVREIEVADSLTRKAGKTTQINFIDGHALQVNETPEDIAELV